MTTYAAEWLLPINGPPLRNAWVGVEDGRITGLGNDEPSRRRTTGTVILPGLVNAHTHLELSYLHGRVPPRDCFVEWVRTLLPQRREHANPIDPAIAESARTAVAQMRAAGTALVGDVSNTLISVPLLREAAFPGQVFHELLGFSVPDARGVVASARDRVSAVGPVGGGVRVSLAPHAPYSVSRDLFAAIRDDVFAHEPHVSSVHLGESRAEVELLRSGTGPMRQLLEDLSAWNDEWRVPNQTPVGYLASLDLIDSRILLVHGVQFDAESLALLAARDVTIVACPRSNAHVGEGAPPLQAFYDAGVKVAVGTDSLASAPDLNVFAELALMRTLAPRVPARQLLASATVLGARALGFDGDFGTIEPGKRAALIEVAVPPGVDDVEEYLVGGEVTPQQIRWVGQRA